MQDLNDRPPLPPGDVRSPSPAPLTFLTHSLTLRHGSGREDTRSFGYNWTHPTEPLTHPFRFFSAAGDQIWALPTPQQGPLLFSPLATPLLFLTSPCFELLWWEESGFVASGPSSANPASLRVYPSGGFLALIMPFFSDTYLPPERGTYATVTDFRAPVLGTQRSGLAWAPSPLLCSPLSLTSPAFEPRHWKAASRVVEH